MVNKRLLINRDMVRRRRELTYEECMEVGMTPMQTEVFIVIDEFWKKYGYGPSLRNIAVARGKMGLGNTKEIVDRLVKLGVVKRMDGMARSVRPVYINFRELDVE